MVFSSCEGQRYWKHPQNERCIQSFPGEKKTCGNKALISHLEVASWKPVSVHNYLNLSQRRNTPKLSCYIFSRKRYVIKKTPFFFVFRQTRRKIDRPMDRNMGSPILHQAPAAFRPELWCESPLGAAAEMSCAIFGMEKTGKFIEVNAGCVEIAAFDDTGGYL